MSHFVVTSGDYSKGTRHDYLHDALEAAEKLSLKTSAPVILAHVGRYGDVSNVYKIRFSKVERRAANPRRPSRIKTPKSHLIFVAMPKGKVRRVRVPARTWTNYRATKLVAPIEKLLHKRAPGWEDWSEYKETGRSGGKIVIDEHGNAVLMNPKPNFVQLPPGANALDANARMRKLLR